MNAGFSSSTFFEFFDSTSTVQDNTVILAFLVPNLRQLLFIIFISTLKKVSIGIDTANSRDVIKIILTFDRHSFYSFLL